MSAQSVKMDERALQSAVLDLARLLGWKCYHTFDSRRSEPGFPDLVMAHPRGGLIFAELKSETGMLTPEQDAWGLALLLTGSPLVIWRPAQWLDGTIERRLQAR